MGFVVSVILNLGVIDIPYVEIEADETTGEVAEKLEIFYGVMQFFVDKHMDYITNRLAMSYTSAINNTLAGNPIPDDVLSDSYGDIEKLFRMFLDNKEMDRKERGVPTQASIDGVSHRFKMKNRKRASKERVKNNPRRPSFIDTGLYQASMKVWKE